MTCPGSHFSTLDRDLQVFCGFHACSYSPTSLPFPQTTPAIPRFLLPLIISSRLSLPDLCACSLPWKAILPSALGLTSSPPPGLCSEATFPVRLPLTTLFKIIPQPHLQIPTPLTALPIPFFFFFSVTSFTYLF